MGHRKARKKERNPIVVNIERNAEGSLVMEIEKGEN